MPQSTPTVHIQSITPDPLKAIWISARNCYFKGSIHTLKQIYTPENGIILFRKLVRMGHDTCLEHVNFQIILEGVSRSFLAQITRHRHVTFHVSSQHFQNHSDFGYVMPNFVNEKNKEIFLGIMEYLNDAYKEILKNGDKHYLAREILPNATACKIIMTLNLRELRYIIKLRQGPENTPEMQMIMRMLRQALELKEPEFGYML